MKNNLFTRRLTYANFILFLFAISMSLTSCKSDLQDIDATKQNDYSKHDEFSKKLIENPIYFEYLNSKIDFLLEYKLILDSKSAESATRIKNHFQSLQSTSKKQSIAEIVAIPELSKEESENLIRVSTNLYESSIQLKKLFSDNNFNEENDINKVFESITMSQKNKNLLSDNLSKFYDSEEKNPLARSAVSDATCLRRLKQCLWLTIDMEVIVAMGCGPAFLLGPATFFVCVIADVVVVGEIGFEVCDSRYRRCLRN